MTPTGSEGTGELVQKSRRQVVRLRTLLVWLAVVPTVAMGVQVLISSDRSVQEIGRAHV